MNDDNQDPIIDVLLDELLGGAKPPDLRGQILAAHAEAMRRSHEKESSEHVDGAKSFDWHIATETPPVEEPAVVRVTPTTRRRTKRRMHAAWPIAVTAATLLLTVGGLAIRNSKHTAPADPLANTPPRTASSQAPRVAQSSEAPSGDLPSIESIGGFEPEPARSLFPPALADESNSTTPESADALLVKSSDREVIEFIDKRLAASWSAAGIARSPAVSARDWCQRTYWRLLGRAPRTDELAGFDSQMDDEARDRLLERLLAGQEFAQHWDGLFADMLLGPQTSGQADRTELERFLRESLRNNKSYDDLVVELLTAEGVNRPAADDYNPATNFLLAYQDDDHSAAAEKACQVFLGRQIQCAQCHDDTLAGTRQEQFWQLTAFFAQMKAAPAADGKAWRLFDQDYIGEAGSPDDAETYFVDARQVTRIAYPVFLDGTAASSESGRVDIVKRRRELAEFVVRSDDFSRAIVNRLWSRFFGFGFTPVVDDMGGSGKVSHPAILDRLAREFQARDHNLRDLIRWMAMCTAFDRRADDEPGGPEFGNNDLFAAYHEPFTSRPGLDESLERLAANRRFELQSNRLLAQPRNLPPSEQDARVAAETIAKLSHPYLQGSSGEFLDRLARGNLTDAEKLSHLFLLTVKRPPTDRERENGLELLSAGNKLQALQDIGWLLISTREFNVGR